MEKTFLAQKKTDAGTRLNFFELLGFPPCSSRRKPAQRALHRTGDNCWSKQRTALSIIGCNRYPAGRRRMEVGSGGAV